MKNLVILFLLVPCSWFLVPSAQADLPTILFGKTNLTTPLTVGQPTTVIGPLVQLQTEGGTILSLQQGSTFTVNENGTLALTAGNLRMGPAGSSPLTLSLPAGPVTTTPLTALTVTVNNTEATGRIYSGSLTAGTRTFTGGEGFALTPTGAHGTFFPAPAQAPAIDNPAALEPAAGPTTPAATPPAASSQPDLTTRKTRLTSQPTTSAPATETPVTTNPNEPTTENPPVTDQPPATETPPTEEPPVTQQPPISEEPPVTEQPPAEQPPITDEPPVTEQPPVTELPPVTEPEQPQPPEQEPDQPAEIPTSLTRDNLYAAFTSLPEGAQQPDNFTATPGTFRLSGFSNGTQQLDETQTSLFGINPTRLNRGSALNLDATSHATSQGITSGLGRWVGGTLVSIGGPASAPNVTTYDNTGNSLHYVWGEQPTAVPTSGHVTYSLFSATQPTYTATGGTAPDSTGATFTGNLSIDFAPGYSGTVGNYHFNGTVTMPQTTTTITEGIANATTSNVMYNIATGPNGVPLSANTFTNTGTLNVTAPTGAIACPSGCTGTVNTAGFGAGMHDAGSLYTINPTGSTGITGAALFTTTTP